MPRSAERRQVETRDLLDAIRSWLETVEIVPPAYADYTPLVRDGLLFFLARLPAARLEALAAAQLELAADASAADRFVALLRECPTLHKLGQVVARQNGLPAELRRRLQVLESLNPPPGAYGIAEIVARELGGLRGLTVSAQALAEGSVAFVVPFAWQDGPGPVRRGVFKALKPDARARLTEDLAVWPETGDYLVARSAELGLAALDFRSLLVSSRCCANARRCTSSAKSSRAAFTPVPPMSSSRNCFRSAHRG